MILLILGFSKPFVAQENSTVSTVTEAEEMPVISKGLEFKPRLGLGLGMFTFYGDIASNHKGFHPTVSRIGYDISITNPLTDYLDIKFYVMWGTLGASERTLTRNENFQSDITTGGLILNYNFENLLKKDRVVSPYIGVGIESVEFLSKTDLKDAQGNFYHYWSDGTIRDLAEDDPLAATANEIYRDYTYETDLRELNADNLGDYPERTLAIPLQAGANFHLGERVKFRVGTSMHFTMTDLIDNLTGESTGNRSGTKGNDKFLYTSFALTYDLKYKKFGGASSGGGSRKNKFDPLICEIDLLDSDEDGVVDFCDSCQNTLKEHLPVNKNGCPLDSDGDLIPDFRDDEKNSPPGAIVDAKGVAQNDQDFYQKYIRYTDTTGLYGDENYIVEKVETETLGKSSDMVGPVKFKLKSPKEYAVIIGVDTTLISPEDMSTILQYRQFRMIEEETTTYFILGGEESIEDIARLVNSLNEKGIKHGGIVEITPSKDGGNGVDVTPIDPATIPTNVTELAEFPEGTVYRVQIGAFRTQLSRKVFADVPNLSQIKGSDGLTRIYAGEFTSAEEAATRKIDMVAKGYKSAFIVAYQGGSRVKLQETDLEVLDPSQDVIRDDVATDEAIRSDLIKYRVQVGAFAKDIPTEVLDLYLQIGSVIPKRDKEVGLIKYFIGNYDSYEEANEFRKELVREGLTDAFVVGDFNGRIISAQEANSLKNE